MRLGSLNCTLHARFSNIVYNTNLLYLYILQACNCISFRIETIDGTAEAGSDYKPLNQMLTFTPTETQKELFIEIVDDDIWEPDEFFFVKMIKIDDSPNVVIGKISINQVTIINDDGKMSCWKLVLPL